MTTPHRILVTGAGGPAGVTVIRTLVSQGITTVGCDINRYAAGLQLATVPSLVPEYRDPHYLSKLLELASQNQVNGLISTMTEELSVLTEPANEQTLAAAGIATWFPPKSDVDACMDKARFAEITEAAGQPVPRTAWGNVEVALSRVPGPWIVKPRFGRGSRDIHALDESDRVRDVWDKVSDPILQTRLGGREFTFDVLVDRGGKLVGGVPRFRLETKAGISTTGRTFQAPGIFELTEAFLASLGHTGPANVQGFIDDDGTFAFTEVNPRFSGGLPLSLGAGADLVGQYVNGMYGEPIDATKLKYVPGTVMIRYWNEVFFTEEAAPLPPLHPIAAPALQD